MLRRSTLLLLFAPVLAWAQKDHFAEAYEKYEQGQLAEARALIDQAVREEAFAQDPGAWLLRGFIYKDLFKGMAPGGAADSLREEALRSLDLCLGKDTTDTYARDCSQAHDYLARTFYNDAARALNAMDAEGAIRYYERHQQTMHRLSPEHDFRARDIEFNNALGTVYTKRYGEDREDTTWFVLAVRTYGAVIALDPENYGANYNLATLFYNRGVYNIQKITPENDIPSLQDIQRASRYYFMEALPYMLKAFDMNPTRKETLLGLEGIYYSLQDIDKSEHYRALYEALEPEEDR